jgi:hypothetical protein
MINLPHASAEKHHPSRSFFIMNEFLFFCTVPGQLAAFPDQGSLSSSGATLPFDYRPGF